MPVSVKMRLVARPAAIGEESRVEARDVDRIAV
jgi:hypothetical protein